MQEALRIGPVEEQPAEGEHLAPGERRDQASALLVELRLASLPLPPDARVACRVEIWVDPRPDNVGRVNAALSEFGSSYLLTANRLDEILQIGVEPDRIDILQRLEALEFPDAWANRITDCYGEATAFWIGIDDLIRVKAAVDHPRHQDDVRVLREVKRLRERMDREPDERC